MTFELWALVGAVLLGLVHVSAASFAFKAQVGNAYTVGARDDDVQPTGTAGRLHRAQRNFQETFPLFAALILVGAASDRTGAWSQWGAALYVAGRIAFLPLYGAGVPWLRTISWNLATLGLVLLGVQLIS